MPTIKVSPGRWLVEVRDDGHLLCSRINEADVAHGGSGPDLLPAWG
jgi:hypothetical protein